jgi:hypothetical protein
MADADRHRDAREGFRVEGMLCDVSKAADVQAVVDKTARPSARSTFF